MSLETQPTAKPADLCTCSHDSGVAVWKQLLVTYLKMQRRVEEMLTPYGLVLSQFEALAKIGLKPGIIQQELVAVLLVTKGNVGALLDRLESIGLVERQSDPNDRRANRLHLTQPGEQMVAEIFQKHCALVREMLQPLDPQQRQTLQSLLKMLEPA
ncbi:MAG TPA: MarR family transcriptional regulator [Tepidisphaeraceae bacterium]|nr:MarR family transcriptional regulator [Tepidisphaeraceae bacterium]